MSVFKLAACAWLVAGLAMSALATPDSCPLSMAPRQVIYEVNVRQFTPEGTLDAFATHLPRLRELGVDILWLMPIHPIGEKNRKGGVGSHYSVADYRAVNPAYGSMADLRQLCGQAHALGMRVILDWVANHCAWDNPIVTQHPEWMTKGPDGQPVPPVADWSDVLDLDFSQPGLRDYMIESMALFLREADVDGFRCDVAGLIPVDFWQQARPRLDAVKPVFMLAEWDDPALAGPFDMSYAWNLHRAFNAYMKGQASVDLLDSLLRGEASRWPAEHLQMRFITNHDENSWNGTEDERLGPAADVFGVICHTLPGMPLLYNGQEAGLNRRLAFFEKDSIQWVEHPRRALFTSLNRLKHSSPALWRQGVGGDAYRRLDPGPGQAEIWAYLRPHEEQPVLVVVNLSAQTRQVKVQDPALQGRWREWEDARVQDLQGQLELNLPPWGWSIWRGATR